MGLHKFVSLFQSNSHSNELNYNNRIKTTFNSELDIYGDSNRYKRSILWSSLRVTRKIKGLNFPSFSLFMIFLFVCEFWIERKSMIHLSFGIWVMSHHILSGVRFLFEFNQSWWILVFLLLFREENCFSFFFFIKALASVSLQQYNIFFVVKILKLIFNLFKYFSSDLMGFFFGEIRKSFLFCRSGCLGWKFREIDKTLIIAGWITVVYFLDIWRN